MALEKILAEFDRVAFSPRSLDLILPDTLTAGLSREARAFIRIAFGRTSLTVLDLTKDKWPSDPTALSFFRRCSRDARIEILAFVTLFVHEYTHRVDFLISPFGLQYYTNTLREYWLMQEFVPLVLDSERTVDQMRFLAGFDERHKEEAVVEIGADRIWKELKELIYIFYAWGDVSSIRPLSRYVKEGWSGWGESFHGLSDPFGLDMALEPVTVLEFFHTFRVPGADQLWYLRPLTLFETKAVVNSLLFILRLLGSEGTQLCREYYEAIYLNRREQLHQDYFFLLDLGARIFDQPDFYSLLKLNHLEMLRSALLILSSACWYALQSPPPIRGDDPRVANPILRLGPALGILTAMAHGRLNRKVDTAAEALLLLDSWSHRQEFGVKAIHEIIPACRRMIDYMSAQNDQRTWNPDVKSHFKHLFALMRPHLCDREHSYVSYMGMPESGNPLLGCSTPEDWEITYTDYETPAAVSDWFAIRTDLLFNLLKPASAVIEQLDRHFMAFFFPYRCDCGQGFTPQWGSRFAEEYHLKCGFCGKTKTIRRDELSIIAAQ
jgi:hypothetical protein